MTAADRKMYWGLLETLQWIGTRNEGRTTAMGDKETSRTPVAMFTAKATLNPHPLLFLANYDFASDCEPVAWPAGCKSLEAKEAGMGGSTQALKYLLQQLSKRRIRMTAIKCGRYRKQIPVPPAELGDLEFRITSDHRVGLWSRSHNTLMWRSPQFLRRDVIRVWPARKKNSAAVSVAVLQHLKTITSPVAPLTRANAQRRCLVEVPDAFPEAFKKAWAILPLSHKRGRGRHGGRTHRVDDLDQGERTNPVAELTDL